MLDISKKFLCVLMISVIMSGCFSRYEVTQTVLNENRSVRFLERNDWGLIGFGICGNVYFNYTIKSKYKLIMPNNAGNHKLSEVEIYHIDSDGSESRSFTENYYNGDIIESEKYLQIDITGYKNEHVDYINGKYSIH